MDDYQDHAKYKLNTFQGIRKCSAKEGEILKKNKYNKIKLRMSTYHAILFVNSGTFPLYSTITALKETVVTHINLVIILLKNALLLNFSIYCNPKLRNTANILHCDRNTCTIYFSSIAYLQSTEMSILNNLFLRSQIT